MQQPTNAVPAWVRFLVQRIIVPVARHFNQHLRELEERNAELTRRVYELEQIWRRFAEAFQPPFVISADSELGVREATRALVKFANDLKPRPDPLTLPTTPDQTSDPQGA